MRVSAHVLDAGYIPMQVWALRTSKEFLLKSRAARKGPDPPPPLLPPSLGGRDHEHFVCNFLSFYFCFCAFCVVFVVLFFSCLFCSLLYVVVSCFHCELFPCCTYTYLSLSTTNTSTNDTMAMSKPVICGICHKGGHRAFECPDRNARGPAGPRSITPCWSCGELHHSNNCPVSGTPATWSLFALWI